MRVPPPRDQEGLGSGHQTAEDHRPASPWRPPQLACEQQRQGGNRGQKIGLGQQTEAQYQPQHGRQRIADAGAHQLQRDPSQESKQDHRDALVADAREVDGEFGHDGGHRRATEGGAVVAEQLAANQEDEGNDERCN